MRAISSFILEVGIDAESCSARFAFRILESMSSIGSVSTGDLLPARLRHSRNCALVRELAQADPAEAELAIDGARATAPVAARVGPGAVLGLPLLLDDERLLGHLAFPSGRGERKTERAEQRVAGLVRLRRRGDRDVQSADPRNLVVVDLRKDDLLPDPDRVVAAAVERSRIESAKVADTRQGDRREPVEKLVHPRAAQRHARADGHPFAELEARDRLRRAADLS